MKVSFSNNFIDVMLSLSEEDYKKIDNFVVHVEKYGLVSLPGSNRKSDRLNVPSHLLSPKQKQCIAFSHEHDLWHYHIGIPSYTTTKGIGKYTSEVYLHYQRKPDTIRIIGLGSHPFSLPSPSMLENHNE